MGMMMTPEQFELTTARVMAMGSAQRPAMDLEKTNKFSRQGIHDTGVRRLCVGQR